MSPASENAERNGTQARIGGAGPFATGRPVTKRVLPQVGGQTALHDLPQPPQVGIEKLEALRADLPRLPFTTEFHELPDQRSNELSQVPHAGHRPQFQHLSRSLDSCS